MSTSEEGQEAGDVLRLPLSVELQRLLEDRAHALDTDTVTLAVWCLQTGLLLADLNQFVRSRTPTT